MNASLTIGIALAVMGSATGAGAQAAPAASTPAPVAASAPEMVAGGSAGGGPAAGAEPQGYTYDAEGRRDPFVSLLRRGADTQRTNTGTRLPGLPGLATAEVTLKGTMASREGYVAIVMGVDSKTYIVRPGEKLLDGSVRTITGDGMVILQQVNDPLSTQKQREVRKVLRQTDEAK